MGVVSEYLEGVESPQKEALQRVKEIIEKTVPEAKEVITYGMPGYKFKDKYLISFAAFKNHMSLFPGAEVLAAMKDELGDHAASKGTIQFSIEEPLSSEQVEKVVRLRADDIVAK